MLHACGGFIFLINFGFEIVDTSQSVESQAGELQKHIQLLEKQREKCKDLEKEKKEDKLTFDQVCTRKFKIYRKETRSSNSRR